MVLQVMKYDIHPDKVEAYLKWVEGAIKRVLAVPGVVEFRSYRPVTGSSQPYRSRRRMRIPQEMLVFRVYWR